MSPAAQADSLRNITPEQIAVYQNVRIDAGRAPNFALPSATRGSVTIDGIGGQFATPSVPARRPGPNKRTFDSHALRRRFASDCSSASSLT